MEIFFALLILFLFALFYIKEQRRKKFIESLLFNLGEGVYGVDKEGRCIWINQKAIDMLGFSKKEILHKNQHVMFHHHKSSGDVYDITKCPIYLTLQDKQTRESEEYFIRKDGSFFLVNLIVRPVNDSEAIVVFRDITDFKKVQNTLEMERSLFSSGPVLSIEWSPSEGWPITYISSNCVDILGYTREEMQSPSFIYATLIHPGDIEKVIKEVSYNIENRIDVFEASYRLKLKNGKYRWFYDFTKLIRDENGNLISIIGYIFDQTKIKETEQELAIEKQRISYILEGTNIGTWEWNISSGEVIINEKWAEIIGYTLEEITPMNVEMWKKSVHPADLKKSLELLEYHFENRINYFECENRIKHKDGSWVWILDRGKVYLWDKNGKPLIMYGTHQDITKKKNIQEKLIEATNKAELANKTKSRFLANMSHEIRTPMNAIIGLSELMLDTELNEKQKEIISKVNTSSKILLGTINDILDYSKIEAGKLELEQKKLNLTDIIIHLNAVFSENIIKKELKLYINKGSQLPNTIIGDELRVSQVLTNLLSNAIKFTHHGSVTLNIELKEKISQREAVISFSVEDTGIGMDDEEQKRLFTPFTQADSSTTRKYGGTGLGLSISKKIIEAMGSILSVESKKNIGSKFSFELDVEVISWEQQNIKKAEDAEEKLNFSGIKVLLVEDNEINQEVASLMLERVGIEVDIANNGKEAVNKYFANKNRYHLILMDLQMPSMSGYEATKIIREHDKAIAIIALSAAAMVEDKKKAIDFGMNAHLGKPIDMNELYAVIAKYTSKEFSTKKIAFKKADNSVLNIEYLKKSIASDKLISKLLKKFLYQLNNDFLNIADNIAKKNIDAPAQIHTLKGLSGNLGANELYNICQIISVKYKQEDEITHSDIKTLVSAITKIIKKLSTFNFETDENANFERLSKNELKNLFYEIKNELLNANMLNQNKKNTLFENLKSIVNSNELSRLDEAISEFEYDKALNIMDGWAL